MNALPISTAPYKREYLHTKRRGREALVTCGICGKRVPRWKTFETRKGFKISDPTILQQVDKRLVHLNTNSMRVCPSCARFHHVVKRGKSVRKKHMKI